MIDDIYVLGLGLKAKGVVTCNFVTDPGSGSFGGERASPPTPIQDGSVLPVDLINFTDSWDWTDKSEENSVTLPTFFARYSVKDKLAESVQEMYQIIEESLVLRLTLLSTEVVGSGRGNVFVFTDVFEHCVKTVSVPVLFVSLFWFWL